MVAQAHKVAPDRSVKDGSTEHRLKDLKSRREEWAPMHPVDQRTHHVQQKSHTRWHLNGDRVGGVIAVSLFVAFVAFIAWVVSHGTPAGYDPSWDYWMWH